MQRQDVDHNDAAGSGRRVTVNSVADDNAMELGRRPAGAVVAAAPLRAAEKHSVLIERVLELERRVEENVDAIAAAIASSEGDTVSKSQRAGARQQLHAAYLHSMRCTGRLARQPARAPGSAGCNTKTATTTMRASPRPNPMASLTRAWVRVRIDPGALEARDRADRARAAGRDRSVRRSASRSAATRRGSG